MKLVFISDTHNLHNNFGRGGFDPVPNGDAIIHCGDITTHGTVEEVHEFLRWFGNLAIEYKIFVAGNHDKYLETIDMDTKVSLSDKYGIIYLEHSSINIDNINIYGHPYTPYHHGMAFNRSRGDEMEVESMKIPENIDILITHGPPKDILDEDEKEEKMGSESLRKRVLEVNPKIHCFGHCHSAYGRTFAAGTTFINASNHTWLWKKIGYTPPQTMEI